MALIILHDLDGNEVAVNTDTVMAAKRRIPGENSQMSEPFTKLFYVAKASDATGFPDSVKETPAEIAALAAK
jgi:hypothetical protein